ncbi:MAG: hypothetical protein RL156_394 [Bacteroidota bacterium]|jgi:pimeloyl-ACP methyl ester carboxylesterase
MIKIESCIPMPLRALLGVAVAILFLAASGCGSSRTMRVVRMNEAPRVSEVSATTVAYPLLLLHGLGQKAHVWEGAALSSYEQTLGLHFGGVLTMKNGRVQCSKNGSGPSDFFTVSFSNPVDSVAAWSAELEQFINEVLRRTGANKVTLVGYSMGGVASRLYLTQHQQNHRVQRLITIGSPHLGSPFARVYSLKAGIKNSLASSSNPISQAILGGALSAVEACETDMPFDAPAMRDLIPPDNAGNFLDRLGKAPHPLDVEYVSVIGNVDVIGDAQKFRTSALQEVLRRVGELYDNGLSALLTPGDGVVSTSSQVITNIPWFADKQDNVRLARTVVLKSVHTQHLQKSPEVQRVTLEAKPELHGSEWLLVNGVPSLVLTYNDYLQPSSSVCSVSYSSMAGERSVQATDQKLVSLPTGERVCYAVIPMPDADFSAPFSVRFSIRNAYGYTTQSTKMWQPLP